MIETPQAFPEKHPPGLVVLFLTEMWERFGFYVVQGLLVIYLIQVFGFNDEQSYAITGGFTAFAYITPIVGGYLADHILGFRRAVLLGGILLCIGYALLSLWGSQILFLALGIIVVGTGLLKPNISSLLGALYQPGDPRRESGFTIFYMGINTGILLATFFSGYVKNYLGWGYSFGLASLGMALGVLNFLLGLKYLNHHGNPPQKGEFKTKLVKILNNKLILALVILAFVVLCTLLIKHETLANIILWAMCIFLGIYLIRHSLKLPNPQSRRHMLALICIIASSIVFWALYFQIFLSTNVFVERVIDKHIFGFPIPNTVFISFEAIFILLTGPILAKLWHSLGIRGINPSAPTKFAVGTLLLVIAFSLLAISVQTTPENQLISPYWVIASYFFITLGEMFVSPIGLSTVTVLSETHMVGMMMGVWFIALGLGGKLAGFLAKFSAIPVGVHELSFEKNQYAHAFWQYAALAGLVGLIMLTLTPRIKRLIAT